MGAGRGPCPFLVSIITCKQSVNISGNCSPSAFFAFCQEPLMQVKKANGQAQRPQKQAAAPRLRTGRRQLDAKSSYSVPMARQGSSRVTRVPNQGLLWTRMQLEDPAYSRSRAPMLCSPMPVLR